MLTSYLMMDVVAYVLSSLAILWAGAGGNFELFSTRVFVAAILTAIAAYFLLRERKDLKSIKPNSGSWMMGIGLGLVYFLIALPLTWLLKSRVAEITDLKSMSVLGILVFAFVLSPACEVIYRKYLAPQWGIKSSAFMEALNFGVGAVNFYFFLLIFIWGYIGSKLSMRFGIVAAMVARSLATAITLLCLKSFPL